MRIGELAGLVGISTRAIRHYHHDPRVEATAQAIVAAIPESARQVIRLPDGDLEETEGGFAAAFYADFAPAQAAAIRRAVDLMRQARRAGGPLDRRETTP